MDPAELTREHPSFEVRQLRQEFRGRGGAGRTVAVDSVSFDLHCDPPGITSLVGQSGSGKSTVARILLGLQQPTSGSVLFGGREVHRLRGRDLDHFRKSVQPVFQDPYAIFNPVYTVDRVLRVAAKKFQLASNRDEALELIRASLAAVQLDPDQVIGRYPHQLSGGQRQRVMLARVHMLRPRFIIADEPVSMLDAQVRKHFLDILIDFAREGGMSTLFITHDLSTVHYVGGRMMILNRGRLVEQGQVSEVMARPEHPYTQLLLASVPRPDPDARWSDQLDLAAVQELDR